MDTSELVTNLVESLAWPLFIFLVMLTFRKPIGGLLRAVRRFKGPWFEVDVDQQIEDIREGAYVLEEKTQSIADLPEVSDLSGTHPTGAIVEAWKAVEQSLLRLAIKNGIELHHHRRSSAMMARKLGEMGILDPQISSILFELRSLRNRVVHEPEIYISQAGAEDYIAMAERLVYLLESITDESPAE